jgi:nucleoside-diphosphate-sugar epimerase
MTLSAFQKKRIIVMGGGSQWRPLIHVSDVSKAFVNVIESKDLKLSQEVFNIGLDNFQIKDLAFLVREQLPFPIDIDVAPDDADKRNYNVIFDKATQKLNFKAENTVISGILEIYNALKQGTVDVGLKTITVQWYRNLLEAKKLLDTVSLNDRII